MSGAWEHGAANLATTTGIYRSDGDVFEWNHDLDGLRDKLWALIDATPNLDWLLLTKRPHLVRRLAPWGTNWPDHVWVGTTVENQRFADQRIRHLIDVPCRYRFLSCEPLLGPIDLSPWIHRLHWIIAGGESGKDARPTQPDWIRSLRDQCSTARVAFHFKQWGNLYPRELSNVGGDASATAFVRTSKKKAGRLIDGRTWEELPYGYSERAVQGS